MPTMTEEKKDCTDELMECTTECDPTDSECVEECVTEYQECDISQEFTAQDVEQCITDGTDYKDCVDHLVATMPTSNTNDEGDLISELLTITSLLGGQMERKETLNSVGRSSKKIIIEYDIKQRDQRSS